jgi:hypothetical protein
MYSALYPSEKLIYITRLIMDKQQKVLLIKNNTDDKIIVAKDCLIKDVLKPTKCTVIKKPSGAINQITVQLIRSPEHNKDDKHQSDQFIVLKNLSQQAIIIEDPVIDGANNPVILNSGQTIAKPNFEQCNCKEVSKSIIMISVTSQGFVFPSPNGFFFNEKETNANGVFDFDFTATGQGTSTGSIMGHAHIDLNIISSDYGVRLTNVIGPSITADLIEVDIIAEQIGNKVTFFGNAIKAPYNINVTLPPFVFSDSTAIVQISFTPI